MTEMTNGGDGMQLRGRWTVVATPDGGTRLELTWVPTPIDSAPSRQADPLPRQRERVTA